MGAGSSTMGSGSSTGSGSTSTTGSGSGSGGITMKLISSGVGGGGGTSQSLGMARLRPACPRREATAKRAMRASLEPMGAPDENGFRGKFLDPTDLAEEVRKGSTND